MKKILEKGIMFVIIFVIAGGAVFGLYTFNEPNTIACYKFQDNKIDYAYIHSHNNYVYSLAHPRKIKNTNDSTSFLIKSEKGYTDITAKYSTTTEPIWTELGNIVDMYNNQYLVDCIKTHPNTTITYCISAKNKQGKLEEFYFSYVIQ